MLGVTSQLHPYVCGSARMRVARLCVRALHTAIHLVWSCSVRVVLFATVCVCCPEHCLKHRCHPHCTIHLPPTPPNQPALLDVASYQTAISNCPTNLPDQQPPTMGAYPLTCCLHPYIAQSARLPDLPNQYHLYPLTHCLIRPPWT